MATHRAVLSKQKLSRPFNLGPVTCGHMERGTRNREVPQEISWHVTCMSHLSEISHSPQATASFGCDGPPAVLLLRQALAQICCYHLLHEQLKQLGNSATAPHAAAPQSTAPAETSRTVAQVCPIQSQSSQRFTIYLLLTRFVCKILDELPPPTEAFERGSHLPLYKVKLPPPQ